MTRTHVTYFDTDQVNKLVGEAYRRLYADYQGRKNYISPEAQDSIEARLAILKAAWTLMLDKMP